MSKKTILMAGKNKLKYVFNNSKYDIVETGDLNLAIQTFLSSKIDLAIINLDDNMFSVSTANHFSSLERNVPIILLTNNAAYLQNDELFYDSASAVISNGVCKKVLLSKINWLIKVNSRDPYYYKNEYDSYVERYV